MVSWLTGLPNNALGGYLRLYNCIYHIYECVVSYICDVNCQTHNYRAGTISQISQANA